MNAFEIMGQLNACHSPSGQEDAIAEKLAALAAPFADEIGRDTLGNLIVRKKGTGPRLLFSAHMDSIGLIVTHIEKDGYLRVGKLGGVSLGSSVYTPFRFQNGTPAALVIGEKTKFSDLKLEEAYLDIGVDSREEAERLVQLGDTAVCAVPTHSMGNRLCSPYLDNRISCFVLLEALSRLGACDCDLYFAFSTQEEVGLRGAKTLAYGLDPDFAVAVDVTSAEEPDSRHHVSCRLGGGAAVKIMDASVLCHPQMVQKLCSIAEEKGIASQRDVITAGGTDAGAIHQSRAGVITGGISIPCRYIHSAVEMVDLRDVEACVQLVCALAEAKL